MKSEPPFQTIPVELPNGQQGLLILPLDDTSKQSPASGEKSLVKRLGKAGKKYADHFMTAFADTFGRLTACACYMPAASVA